VGLLGDICHVQGIVTDIGYPSWKAVYVGGFAMGPGKFHFLNSVVIGLYIRIIVGRTGVSYILHLYSPGPSLLVV
jgi:hypothetical protein